MKGSGARPIASSSASKSPSAILLSPVGGSKKHLPPNSFDWIKSLLHPNRDTQCVPVASFKHVPLTDVWDDLVTIGLKVEVKNVDTDPSSPLLIGTSGEIYWIASVVKISGYFILLRYEGFGSDDSKDFWINIFTTHIHPVGWCASQGKALIPPKTVGDRYHDWKDFLVKRLTGSRTLPENFYEQMRDSLKSRFQQGMRLEVVDKHRISAVRVAKVDLVIGGRLHVIYEGAENEPDPNFWCHQSSPLIHPVGWAQLVGHELRATAQYAQESLHKAMNRRYDPDDADWTLFPPTKTLLLSQMNQPNQAKTKGEFEEGMKLEAIDPLVLSNICVATVMKVLRCGYLMIGIDDVANADGSDWFCYHSTSPCIFPVGFCKFNNIDLTPPPKFQQPDGPNFDWSAYLSEKKAKAAPVHLFRKDIPQHEFQEGMFVEAVDLMEPRLICVATITRVVGRLLRVHFNGWDESYDQWCDCESPELFPVGWCQLVGYKLEPPKDHENNINGSNASQLEAKRKRSTYKGRSKKRKVVYNKQESVNGHDSLNQSFSSNGSFPLSDGESGHSSSSYATPRNNNGGNSFNLPQHSHPTSVSPKIPPSGYRIQQGSSTGLPNSSVVVRQSPPEPVGVMKNRGNDVENWSIADVADFLRENEWGQYAHHFIQKVP